MIRTIYLKVTIDWENYEDVSDDLIIEDSGILDSLKDGVMIEHIDAPFIIPKEVNFVATEGIPSPPSPRLINENGPVELPPDKTPMANTCNSGLPYGFLFNETGRVVLDPRVIPDIDDD